MADEMNENEPSAAEDDAMQADEAQHDERTLKESLRGGAAKAVGFAVEVGSMLSGQGGEIVNAERDVAEAETEELLDRIDGEG